MPHTSAQRPGQAAIDAWRLAHVATGIALSRIRFSTAMNLLVAWEAMEVALRRSDEHDGGIFEYESRASIVADVVFGAIGWGVGKLLCAKR